MYHPLPILSSHICTPILLTVSGPARFLVINPASPSLPILSTSPLVLSSKTIFTCKLELFTNITCTHPFSSKTCAGVVIWTARQRRCECDSIPLGFLVGSTSPNTQGYCLRGHQEMNTPFGAVLVSTGKREKEGHESSITQLLLIGFDALLDKRMNIPNVYWILGPSRRRTGSN